MTDAPTTAAPDAGRRAATHPSEYLWTADTAAAAHIRAAVLATMTRKPVLIITGPACFFVRVGRADPLDGLAPASHVSGGINVQAAEAFLLEHRAELAADAQRNADEDAATAEALAIGPSVSQDMGDGMTLATADLIDGPEIGARLSFGPEPSATLIPLDPDTTDATEA